MTKNNQTKNWQTTLEYALPDKLTEEEKQVIRNNVENLLAVEYERGARAQAEMDEKEDKKLIKKVEGINQTLDKIIGIIKK